MSDDRPGPLSAAMTARATARFIWRCLRVALPSVVLAAACASPAVVVSPAGPGVPVITDLSIVPSRTESGCPIVLSIDFQDGGADVVRAIARWRARTAPKRSHNDVEALPIAPVQLQGKAAGRVDVVIVPPHAGNYLYRIQLEDGQGQTSNVAEARVYVDIRPFWRARRCQPGSEGQS